jgi:hypothetical protein
MAFGLGPTEILMVVMFVIAAPILLAIVFALWYFFLNKKPEAKK